MITHNTHTKDWIFQIRSQIPKSDPILIEKMIMALYLLEQLQLSGLEFIFKGGTSLPLIIGAQHRFSIDIDIIISKDDGLMDYFQSIIRQSKFLEVQENVRTGILPKRHFKFLYQSVIQNKIDYILLDILFQKNPYPLLQTIEINSPLLQSEGIKTIVNCPTVECLLGDKLTAFAPQTTGIPYGVHKELEIIKQLFDVSILFDVSEDLNITKITFMEISSQELQFRNLHELAPEEVLQDCFSTSIILGLRGGKEPGKFNELNSGIKKLTAYIFSQFFSIDSAILCASKVAYLSSLLLAHNNKIERFSTNFDFSSWKIENPNFNKLNKLKKTNLEAFYYFYKSLELNQPGFKPFDFS